MTLQESSDSVKAPPTSVFRPSLPSHTPRGLVVSVTMSEDEDEKRKRRKSLERPDSSNDDSASSSVESPATSSLNLTNLSAWALMQDYCGGADHSLDEQAALQLLGDSILSPPLSTGSSPRREEWAAAAAESSSVLSVTPIKVSPLRHENNKSHDDNQEDPHQLIDYPQLGDGQDSLEKDSIEKPQEFPQMSDNSHETKLSVFSIQPSEPSLSLPRYDPDKHQQNDTSLATLRKNSVHIGLAESKVYLDRIAELEQALHERDQELHAALRRNQQLEAKQQACTPISNGKNSNNNESLWERNQTLVKEVRFADQTCVELSGQKKALEQQIQLLQDQLQHTRLQNDTLQQELREAIKSQVRTEAALNNLQQQQQCSSKVDDRLERLQRDNRDLLDDLEQSQTNVTYWERKYQEIQEQRKAERSDSHDELNRAQENEQQLESQLAATEERLHELDQDLHELVEDFTECTSQNADYEAECKELQSRIIDLERECLQLQQQKKSSEELALALDEQAELQAELDAMVQQRDSLEEELESCRQQLEKSKNGVEVLESRVDSLEQMCGDLRQRSEQLESVQTEKDRLSCELERTLEELEAARESLRMKESQLLQSEAQVESSSDEVTNLQSRISSLEQTCSDLHRPEGKLESLQNERSRLFAELDVSKGKLISAQATIRNQEAALNRLKTQQEKMSASLATASSTFKLQADMLEMRVSDRLGGLLGRLDRLAASLHFIKDSLQFPEESVSDCASSLTEESGSPVASAIQIAEGDAPVSPSLNVTFTNDLNDLSMVLELMEEARSTEPLEGEIIPQSRTPCSEGGGSSTPDDTMSSIAGISHLFSLSLDDKATDGQSNTISADERQDKQILSPQLSEIARTRSDALVSLERQCEGAQVKIEGLQSLLSTSTKELEEAKEALSVSMTDRAMLLDQLKNSEQRTRELESDLEAKTGELNSAFELSSKLTTSLDGLTQERDGLLVLARERGDKDTTLAQLRESLRESQSQVFSLTSDKEQLKTETDDMSRELAKVTNLLVKSQDQCDRLKSEAGELCVLISTLERQLKDAQGALRDAEEKNVSIGSHRDGLKADMDQMATELNDLTSRYSEVSMVVKRMEQELKGTQEGLRESQSTLLSTEHQRDEVRSQMEQMRLEAQKLDECYANLAAAMARKEQDLEFTLDALRKSEARLVTAESERDKLKACTKQLEDEIRKLKSGRDELSASMEATEKALTATRVALRASEAQLESVESQRMKWKSDIEQTNVEIRALRSRYDELAITVEEKEKAHRQSETMCAELEASSSAKVVQIQNKLESVKDDYERQLQCTQSDLDASDKRVNALLQSDEKHRRAISDLRASLDESHAVCESLSSENERIRLELEQTIANAEDHRHKIRRLQHAKNESDAAIDVLEGEKEGLQQEIEERKMMLAKSEEEVKNLNAKSAESIQSTLTMEREIHRLEEALQESDYTLENLQKSYVRCNDKLASFAADHKELEENKELLHAAEDLALTTETRYIEVQNKLQEVQRERDELLHDQSNLQDSLERMKDSLRDAEARLQEDGESYRNKIASLEQARDHEARIFEHRIESTMSELEANQHLLSRAEQELGELRSTVQDLSEKSRDTNALKDELNASTRALTRAKADNVQVQEVLGRKDLELTELRSRNNSLQNKCSRLREYIRKLTEKLDQWESFHDLQSDVLEKLKSANERTRQKAAKLAKKFCQRDVVRRKSCKWKVSSEKPVYSNTFLLCILTVNSSSTATH